MTGAPAADGVKPRKQAVDGLLLLLVLAGAYLLLALLSRTTSPLTAVASNSMAPFLKRGDLAFLQGVSPAAIQVGDVIAFDVPRTFQDQYGYPQRILHRVVGINFNTGEMLLETRGDNTSPDPFSVHPSQVRGRYVGSVPWLGNVLLYLQSRQGVLFLLLLLAILFSYEFGGSIVAGIRSALGVPTAPAGQGAAAATGGASPEVATALSGFAAAMQEYATHLQSHTAVMTNLREVTLALGGTVKQERQVLEDIKHRLLSAPGERGIVLPNAPTSGAPLLDVDPLVGLPATGPALGVHEVVDELALWVELGRTPAAPAVDVAASEVDHLLQFPLEGGAPAVRTQEDDDAPTPLRLDAPDDLQVFTNIWSRD